MFVGRVSGFLGCALKVFKELEGILEKVQELLRGVDEFFRRRFA